MKCRPTMVEKYVEKMPYFAKFCFLVYDLSFLYISGNFPKVSEQFLDIFLKIEQHAKENTVL